MNEDRRLRMATYRSTAVASRDLMEHFFEKVQEIVDLVEVASNQEDEGLCKGLMANLAQLHLRIAVAVLSSELKDDDEDGDVPLPGFFKG